MRVFFFEYFLDIHLARSSLFSFSFVIHIICILLFFFSANQNKKQEKIYSLYICVVTLNG
jgi:hypothetical protein